MINHRRWLQPLLLLAPLQSLASPPVSVSLKASFPSAPYLLELLETAATENATSYFPLLDRIADGSFSSAHTDQELYTQFLAILKEDGHITQPDDLSSFQIALSLRSAAPRIEAHYQYYTSTAAEKEEEDGCEAWVAFAGKQYCNPELDKSRSAAAKVGSYTERELPFDRILGDPNNRLAAVLYVDVTSAAFSNFHKTLRETARQGKTSYRVRHKPSAGKSNENLLVSGYGVELALKKTDYIVIDDRQSEEGQPPNQDSKGGAQLEEGEDIADVKPLSKSELEILGTNAASFVLGSKEPLDTLLKLTQDFPKHSSALNAHNASEELQKEWKGNRLAGLPAGINVLWINGVQIDPRKIDPYSLLDHLRSERKLIAGVRKLGFSGPEAIGLLSQEAITATQAEDEPQRYDYRDANEGGGVIMWMNDIEKDTRYEGWPTEVISLLQRSMYPGQLPQVRKDIHNIIVPVDFSSAQDVGLVLETVRSLIQRGVAVRWGLVPLLKSPAAELQARIAYHLLGTYGLKALMAHLEASITLKNLGTPDKTAFEANIKGAKLKAGQTVLSFDDVLGHEPLGARLDAVRSYLKRLAISGSEPPVFVNGIPITRNEEWLQTMSNRIGLDMRKIQQGVYEKAFGDDDHLASFFTFQAALNRNPLLIPEDETTIRLFDAGKLWDDHSDLLDSAPRIHASEKAKEQWAQMIVVGDFDTGYGETLLAQSAEYRFPTSNDSVEIIYVHNGNSTKPTEGFSWSKGLATLADEGAPLVPEELTKPWKAGKAVKSGEDAAEYWTSAQPLLRTLGIKAGEQAIIVNGRLVGPLPSDTTLLKEDFETVLSYEVRKRIGPASEAIKGMDLFDKVNSPLEAARLSSIIALSTKSDVPEGMFETPNTLRSNLFEKLNTTHSMIAKGDLDSATVQIFVSIDPATEVAQRWIPIVKVLSELEGVHLRIYLNPKPNLSELPVKRFYRYVLEPKPTFADDGSVKGLGAKFSGIPAEALLTMGMDVAASWLVAPKESIHDLDNIKLSSLSSYASIDALYELENILIEGHSRDLTAGIPPRGAQLILSSGKDDRVADTLIMANLGYFQFKASPGFYKISLQSGRSQEIFKIESAGTKGYNAQPGDETTEIALTSFQGATIFPRISRNPGMEAEDVLEPSTSFAEDLAEKASEVAEGLLAKVGLGSDFVTKGLKSLSSLVSPSETATQSAHADINIFSVASGHLYERMLGIMMLSVMKNTNHTVKFWFIEQFLSPSFKSFLPALAEEYGFSYALVTYKWPHWLRAQKEKQREIWGYKILFLDVLFPLDLDKVIFVDADQIVRTDMHTLVTHDLQGAPYGFVPMCDSRTEMEGFRFWKQGYWKNFLRGAPYHISALYVVDLRRFRAMAAGDRLRQQYHQLSADPGSLSNLDQDLPNNMQAMLPIHSLPQEWLWCETWCSDESLKDAKTIDLCNNPQTKEPKLDRARRQVPEWTVLDEEVRAVARRRGEEGGAKGKSEQELETEREFERERGRKDEL